MRSYILHSVMSRLFVIILVLNFTSQKVIDNDAVCGDIGSNEDHCPFAIQHPDDHGHEEESDHVCVNCPCNLTLFVSWDLYLTRIYKNLSVLYYSISNPVVIAYEDPIRLFRPPRNYFLS
ncbi:hypothetical protein CH375_17245 [Leptospira ellisii]|uniref:DUF2946 domain-containing protein n=1 Tax=Leptospira ellisii TaxID=2023197 RepID=A0A2N0B3F1_9LEPT|nr:hypothetical protein CH379_20725 [Leptospira ellisii]PKA03396.1 hypothetical protein CH375_17245 [Leptospira ellisii]